MSGESFSSSISHKRKTLSTPLVGTPSPHPSNIKRFHEIKPLEEKGEALILLDSSRSYTQTPLMDQTWIYPFLAPLLHSSDIARLSGVCRHVHHRISTQSIYWTHMKQIIRIRKRTITTESPHDPCPPDGHSNLLDFSFDAAIHDWVERQKVHSYARRAPILELSMYPSEWNEFDVILFNCFAFKSPQSPFAGLVELTLQIRWMDLAWLPNPSLLKKLTATGTYYLRDTIHPQWDPTSLSSLQELHIKFSIESSLYESGEHLKVWIQKWNHPSVSTQLFLESRYSTPSKFISSPHNIQDIHFSWTPEGDQLDASFSWIQTYVQDMLTRPNTQIHVELHLRHIHLIHQTACLYTLWRKTSLAYQLRVDVDGSELILTLHSSPTNESGIHFPNRFFPTPFVITEQLATFLKSEWMSGLSSLDTCRIFNLDLMEPTWWPQHAPTWNIKELRVEMHQFDSRWNIPELPPKLHTLIMFINNLIEGTPMWTSKGIHVKSLFIYFNVPPSTLKDVRRTHEWVLKTLACFPTLRHFSCGYSSIMDCRRDVPMYDEMEPLYDTCWSSFPSTLERIHVDGRLFSYREKSWLDSSFTKYANPVDLNNELCRQKFYGEPQCMSTPIQQGTGDSWVRSTSLQPCLCASLLVQIRIDYWVSERMKHLLRQLPMVYDLGGNYQRNHESATDEKRWNCIRCLRLQLMRQNPNRTYI